MHRRPAAPTGLQMGSSPQQCSKRGRGAAHHSHPRRLRSSMGRRRRRARAAPPGPRPCRRQMSARSRRRRGPPTSSALLGDEQKRCAVPRPTRMNWRSRCARRWTTWCPPKDDGRRLQPKRGRRWPRSCFDLGPRPMMTMPSSLPSCMVVR